MPRSESPRHIVTRIEDDDINPMNDDGEDLIMGRILEGKR